MIIITVRVSKSKLVRPYMVKNIICKPMDGKLSEILSMDENEVFGKDTLSIKLSDECHALLLSTARAHDITISSLVRKALVYMNKHPETRMYNFDFLTETRDKICAGLDLFSIEDIKNAQELEGVRLPHTWKNRRDCYLKVRYIAWELHLKPSQVERRVLWLYMRK